MKCVLSAAILLAVALAVSGREIPANELQRIAGGTAAAAAQYPYQVSLRVYFEHFCGGSILNNRWVLTAAHCIEDKRPDEISVIAGTNLLAEAGMMYQAIATIINPKYNGQTRANDAGLIKVSRNIVFTGGIRAIPLPTGPFNKANYSAILTGWGSASETGKYMEQLQALQVTVLAQADCLEKQKNVTATQICSLDKVGVGACNGDGGDPLVADGVQIGITSIVTPCAKGSPIIYTRVWNLVSWINQNIASTGKSYIA